MSNDADRLLQILRETCLSEVRSDQPDLPLRHLAVLLVIYQTDEPQTVRGLAKHLNINKPAITRALDRLEDLDFAYRGVDPKDRCSVLVQRTADGAAMVERIGALMVRAATEPGHRA